MTKTMEILEIISEGYNSYYADITRVISVDDFIEMKKLYEEEVNGVKMYGDNGWFVTELKDGWFSYGYEGEEYWGMFKVVVSEEEKDRVLNMGGDELEDFVEENLSKILM